MRSLTTSSHSLCYVVRDDKGHQDIWKRGRARSISLYEQDIVPPGLASPLTYRALSSRTAGRWKWEGKGGEPARSIQAGDLMLWKKNMSSPHCAQIFGVKCGMTLS